MPHLALSTYKCRTGDDRRWRLAQQVLPRLRDRVADTIEDPLDRCKLGPFVLAHMNLNPQNIIFAREGGHIMCVLDWETSLTVPLWALVCYPSWFGQVFPTSRKRHSRETQIFKDTYIRELQRLTLDPFILSVVQNPRLEAKRRFAEVATLPWPKAHFMLEWINENVGKR
ncbi:hypothetical protein GGU11DRAFT_673910 [Lentinula aff. detonsa]|uniref:Aminoglycoside phosphotransferase domain-containing protein n=1 Tax=Lentinula aff. detonsa TaxID=2804958 RepID=A0AA38U6S0_9AGAR|nr:hypothetical protein GGU10DRAFT_258999 [Lentinula aff. detonsa]KAJ3801956.1 hypothetical protein GGU11DRAFT_673910 [Lentinula aff. detonsa]